MLVEHALRIALYLAGIVFLAAMTIDIIKGWDK